MPRPTQAAEPKALAMEAKDCAEQGPEPLTVEARLTLLPVGE